MQLKIRPLNKRPALPEAFPHTHMQKCVSKLCMCVGMLFERARVLLHAWVNRTDQGTLTEGEGSVQLTSLLR